ncbi:MAG TPA: sigma-70 family RNA polymerase sigma factor [Candidatus Limnocylindrales bacterium]|nr:sigma-70 family RNA polymerase sigma factor [Candidatus Limnocylindrales bacterium]
MASDRSGVSRDEFIELVERYNVELLRLAVAMARDARLAEDAVQATWQKAWATRESIRERDRVAGWLFTITANEVRRQLRRQRLGRILQARLSEPRRPEAPGPQRVDLGSALDALSVEDRQLVGLRFGIGLTSEEIAPLLGLSGPGVRRRLQRVLARLRADLGDD